MSDSTYISYPQDAHSITRQLEDESYWYQHRNNMIATAVDAYVSKNETIYDIGGGNGVVTKALINKAYNCVLVEAFSQAVDMAKKRGVDNVVQSTIQNFTNNNLDMVLLLDVIEHMEDDAAVIRQLFHQIKNGGYLIITVPAFNHLTTNVDKEIGHYRRYTVKEISQLLKQQGFIIKQNTYFFSLLYFPALILRVLKHRLGIQSKDNTKRRQQEHLSNNKRLNNFIVRLFRFELFVFKKKMSIPFGTSCLIIAHKP